MSVAGRSLFQIVVVLLFMQVVGCHGLHVAVVGSVNVDKTTIVKRLPGKGETVAGTDATRAVGGKGANQATAAAKLLAVAETRHTVQNRENQVSLFACVGNGEDAEYLWTKLFGFGLNLKSLIGMGQIKYSLDPGLGMNGDVGWKIISESETAHWQALFRKQTNETKTKRTKRNEQ